MKFLTDMQAICFPKLNIALRQISNEILEATCAGRFSCEVKVNPMVIKDAVFVLKEANFAAEIYENNMVKVEW